MTPAEHEWMLSSVDGEVCRWCGAKRSEEEPAKDGPDDD